MVLCIAICVKLAILCLTWVSVKFTDPSRNSSYRSREVTNIKYNDYTIRMYVVKKGAFNMHTAVLFTHLFYNFGFKFYTFWFTMPVLPSSPYHPDSQTHTVCSLQRNHYDLPNFWLLLLPAAWRMHCGDTYFKLKKNQYIVASRLSMQAYRSYIYISHGSGNMCIYMVITLSFIFKCVFTTYRRKS